MFRLISRSCHTNVKKIIEESVLKRLDKLEKEVSKNNESQGYFNCFIIGSGLGLVTSFGYGLYLKYSD